jgi:hypothetical protein
MSWESQGKSCGEELEIVNKLLLTEVEQGKSPLKEQPL